MLIGFATAGILAAASATTYHFVKNIPISGDAGWDYLTVDAGSRHVFVSHGNEVAVVNADTGKLDGTIQGTTGVHGIAVAPDLNRGFTSNGGDNTVTIFDLTTLAVISKSPTGMNPDAIVYDPVSKRVFAFNKRGNSATAIDGATGSVAGTIDLGGNPEFAAVDGQGSVFNVLTDKSALVRIDAKTLQLTNTWPIAPCVGPSGLAMDGNTERLMAGCRNQMTVIVNGRDGKVLGSFPIGTGVDATAFDPGAGLFFNSCGGGDGAVYVVHEKSETEFTDEGSVPTQPGARTMAVDPRTHRLFLSAAGLLPAPPAGAAPPTPGGRGAFGGRGRGFAPGSFHLIMLEP